LTDKEKEMVGRLSRYRYKPSQILADLREINPSLLANVKDISNCVAAHRARRNAI
jgi:hypothetical protein